MRLNFVYVLPVVALLGVAACGGNNQNQQPMTPAAGQSQTGNMPEPTGNEPVAPQTGVNEPGAAPEMGGPQGGGVSPGGAGGPSGQQGGQQGAGDHNMPGMGGGAGATADQGSLSDAQIVSILDTLNRGEEKEAQLAVGKAKDGKVKQFAQMMLTGHRDANRRMMAAIKKANITPAQTSMSTQLDNDVTQALDSMRNKNGADFDKAYIDDQVKMHTQALDLIDNRLLPNAKDATLKAEIQQMRASVADHLRRAQDIQQSLQNSPTNQQPQGGQQSPSDGQQYPKK